MLIHFGRHQDAHCGQLDQIGRSLALRCQHSEVAIGYADSQVESVLSVGLDAVELLYERNHGVSVLRGDAQRIYGKLKVVSDRSLFLQHGKVGSLRVFGRGLSL